MPAMPRGFGNVELVGRDVGALTGTAPDLDIEGAPPLAVVGGGAVVALPALAGGEVLELALGMERRQRAGEVVRVLRFEVAANESGEVGIHGGRPML